MHAGIGICIAQSETDPFVYSGTSQTEIESQGTELGLRSVGILVPNYSSPPRPTRCRGGRGRYRGIHHREGRYNTSDTVRFRDQGLN